MLQKFKITTCAFILCLFGLTLMMVSPVFAVDSQEFIACQKIKGNMKQKKNCFRDLARQRDSQEFIACQKIKGNMKRKKNCFRDLARSLQAGGQAQTPAPVKAPASAQAQAQAQASAQASAQAQPPAKAAEQVPTEIVFGWGRNAKTLSLGSPEGRAACGDGFIEMFGMAMPLTDDNKCKCVAAGIHAHESPACGREKQ